MLDAITIALIKKYHKNLAGGNGGSDGASCYQVIEQKTASAVWKIQHKLNKFPSVTVIDSGNNVCVGDVVYIDENNIEITFSAPFSGKCILN